MRKKIIQLNPFEAPSFTLVPRRNLLKVSTNFFRPEHPIEYERRIDMGLEREWKLGYNSLTQQTYFIESSGFLKWIRR